MAKQQTAADFLRELKRNSEFIAREEQRDVERSRTAAMLLEEQASLLEELRTAKIEVTSVWDLVNSGEAYSAAIPILTAHLTRPYSNKTKEGIARALTVPDARGIATSALIREFSKSPDSSSNGVKWAIGNALSVACDRSSVDAVIELARDKHHGKAREMLPLALVVDPSDRVTTVLTELLDDPDVKLKAKEALMLLQRV